MSDPINLLINHYEQGCITGNMGHTNALLTPQVMSLKEELNTIETTNKIEDKGKANRQKNIGSCDMPSDLLDTLLNKRSDMGQDKYGSVKSEILGLIDFMKRPGLDIKEISSLLMNQGEFNCEFLSADDKENSKYLFALLYLMKFSLKVQLEKLNKISLSDIMCLILSVILGKLNLDLSLLTEMVIGCTYPARCFLDKLQICFDDIQRLLNSFAEIEKDHAGKGESTKEAQKVPNVTGLYHVLQEKAEYGQRELEKKIEDLIMEINVIKKNKQEIMDRAKEAYKSMEQVAMCITFVKTIMGLLDSMNTNESEDAPPPFELSNESKGYLDLDARK